MAYTHWLDSSGILLDDGFPLPLTQPFLRSTAIEAGCSARDLHDLVDRGLLRKVLRGVYATAQAPNTVRFRAHAVSLVIPDHAVVTGRTAGWLHGMPVLRRGAHLEVPQLEVSHTTDSRCIRPEVEGHRRQLRRHDITVVHGVRVTTPLRTVLDLGRLLWMYDAIAALDAGLRLGLDRDQLLMEAERFKGHRGVVQLRALLTVADGRAESPGESALRLHWLQAGLPRPELQIWIYDDDGMPLYRLDVGLPEVRYAAEYDGIEFHTAAADIEYDKRRRDWIRAERGWSIDAFDKDPVYGMNTDIQNRLQIGFHRARGRMSPWQP